MSSSVEIVLTVFIFCIIHITHTYTADLSVARGITPNDVTISNMYTPPKPLMRFDFESSSSAYLDVSGNGLAASPRGFPTVQTMASAQGSRCLQFSSSGDHLILPNVNSLLQSEATLSMWVKLRTANPQNSSALFATGSHSTSQLYVGGDGKGHLQTFRGSAASVTITWSSDVDRTMWTLLTVTTSPETGWRVYENGRLVAYDATQSVSLSGDAWTVSTATTTVDGWVDDIRVWSVALSQDDIAILAGDVTRIPVVVYDFESANTPGYDSSTHGHDASSFTRYAHRTSLHWMTGTSSLALQPASSAQVDYLTIPTSAVFASQQASVCAWLKVRSSTPNGGWGLWSLGTVDDVYQPGATQASFGTFRSVALSGLTLNAAIDVTKWHHLCITTDATANSWRLYQNGAEVHSTTAGTFNIAGWRLGAGATSTGFDGWIDDFRLYNVVLTPTEIQAMAGRRGLIALYEFESVGTPWIDTSGYGQTATATGGASVSTAQAAVGSGCLVLNSASYIQLPDMTAAFSLSEATLSFWVRSSTTADSGFISFSTAIVDSQYPAVGNVSQGVMTTFRAFGQQITVDLLPSIALDSWHLVTFTSSAVSGWRMYQNGELVHSTSQGTFALGDWIVGASTNSQYFSGFIDDVRLYNRVLRPEEILSLSVAGGVGVHYTFDQTDTAYDQSGHGYSATFANGAAVTSATPAAIGNGVVIIGGSGAQLQFPDMSSLFALTQAVTVSFWLRLNAATPATAAEAALGSVGPTPTTPSIYIVPADGSLQISFWRGAGDELSFPPSATVRRDRWHLITCTAVTSVLTPGAASWRFYQNDQLMYTTTQSSLNANNAGWQLGVSGAASMDGAIDDVRIYTRALSYNEIQLLYSFQSLGAAAETVSLAIAGQSASVSTHSAVSMLATVTTPVIGANAVHITSSVRDIYASAAYVYPAGCTMTLAQGTIEITSSAAVDGTLVLTAAPIGQVEIPLSASHAKLRIAEASLTFDNTNWNIPQSFQVYADDDFLVEDPMTVFIVAGPSLSSSAGFSALSTSQGIIVTSNHVGTVNISLPTDTTLLSGTHLLVEGSTISLRVVLTSRPRSNVYLTYRMGAASPLDTICVTLPTSITFTPATWNITQTIALSAFQDGITQSPPSRITYFEITTSSADFDFAFIANYRLPLTTLDGDIVGAVQTLPLNGTTTYKTGGNVTLNSVLIKHTPSSQSVVIVKVLYDRNIVRVYPDAMNLTNSDYQAVKTLTVVPIQDFVASGNYLYYVNISSTNDQTNDVVPVALYNIDNNVASVSFTPSGLIVTNETGLPHRLQLSITSRPTAPVVFTAVSSVPSQARPTPSSVTITPASFRSTPTITVIGQRDSIHNGNQSFVLTVTTVSADPNYHGQVFPLPGVNLDIYWPNITSMTPRELAQVGGPTEVFGTEFVPGMSAWITGVEATNQTVVNATYFKMTSPQVNFTGQAQLILVNPDGGKLIYPTIFVTDNCPFQGQFGYGLDCKPCPVGAYCPGGPRIYAFAGYWAPFRDEGSVYACGTPPFLRCPGDANSTINATETAPHSPSPCGVGYAGFVCRDCAPDYYYEAATFRCNECENEVEQLIRVVAQFLFLGLFFIVLALGDKKMQANVQFILVNLRVLWLVTVSSNGGLPDFIAKLYSSLAMFAGDLSFVHPGCAGISSFVQLWSINNAVVLGVAVPLILLNVIRYRLWIYRTRKELGKVRATALRQFKRELLERIAGNLTNLFMFTRDVVLVMALQAVYCTPSSSITSLVLAADSRQYCFQGAHTVVFILACVMFLAVGFAVPIMQYQLCKQYYTTRRKRALGTVRLTIAEITVDEFKTRQGLFGVYAMLFIDLPLALCAVFLNNLDWPQFGCTAVVLFGSIVYVVIRRPFNSWPKNVGYVLTFVASLCTQGSTLLVALSAQTNPPNVELVYYATIAAYCMIALLFLWILGVVAAILIYVLNKMGVLCPALARRLGDGVVDLNYSSSSGEEAGDELEGEGNELKRTHLASFSWNKEDDNALAADMDAKAILSASVGPIPAPKHRGAIVFDEALDEDIRSEPETSTVTHMVPSNPLLAMAARSAFSTIPTSDVAQRRKMDTTTSAMSAVASKYQPMSPPPDVRTSAFDSPTTPMAMVTSKRETDSKRNTVFAPPRSVFNTPPVAIPEEIEQIRQQKVLDPAETAAQIGKALERMRMEALSIIEEPNDEATDLARGAALPDVAALVNASATEPAGRASPFLDALPLQGDSRRVSAVDRVRFMTQGSQRGSLDAAVGVSDGSRTKLSIFSATAGRRSIQTSIQSAVQGQMDPPPIRSKLTSIVETDPTGALERLLVADQRLSVSVTPSRRDTMSSRRDTLGDEQSEEFEGSRRGSGAVNAVRATAAAFARATARRDTTVLAPERFVDPTSALERLLRETASSDSRPGSERDSLLASPDGVSRSRASIQGQRNYAQTSPSPLLRILGKPQDKR
eukprot:TRINITY_DN1869_c0_g2_i1.p1 TRINITY_DN1869_c0_g2~~TRINITY_DN1869_c0_g2_i1.p1  ORF type:complete len:2455 (-),score=429.36 TRINITY_DN1869_c0_g2_i1:10699-18063(-)